MTTATSEKLLSFVARSPALQAANDRDGWLRLFIDDGVLEDPVGTPAVHKANGTLGAFWDTFMAPPHEMRFEVRRDHILDRDVFRDVVLRLRLGESIEFELAAFILYELDEDQTGALRLRRLAGHWRLEEVALLCLKLGPRGWIGFMPVFRRMLEKLGPGWVAGYVSAFWQGIGAGGIARARELVTAIEARDRSRLVRMFTDTANVELGGTSGGIAALLDGVPAGSRLRIDGPVSAGWTTVFRCAVEGPAPSDGLVLLEFTTDGLISRARFFTAVPR